MPPNRAFIPCKSTKQPNKTGAGGWLMGEGEVGFLLILLHSHTLISDTRLSNTINYVINQAKMYTHELKVPLCLHYIK